MPHGVVADRDDLVQHRAHLGELAGQEALDQRERFVEDGDPLRPPAAAEVDVVSRLVGVRLERGDRVVVDGREVRDLADAADTALEAKAARAVGERALHRLALARAAAPARRRPPIGGEMAGGEAQPVAPSGRNQLAADRQRGERAVRRAPRAATAVAE